MRRTLALALSLASAAAAAAQPPAAPPQYRGYALGANMATVIAVSGASDARPHTLQERPERLQVLDWRASYTRRDDVPADPVQSLQFHFVGDALYRIVVRYDRERTLGLTPEDLVEAISQTFGAAQPEATLPPVVRDVAGDMTVLREWALPGASVSLLRTIDTPDYTLVLASIPLSARAAAAAREAARLDGAEAAGRALDSRTVTSRDAATARDQARARNKPAFRP